MTIIQKFIKLKKKITDHTHDKYINTPEFNKLTAENIAARFSNQQFSDKDGF